MTERTESPVEICIIGSGIAGSTMAVELSAAGHQVLILEAGPEKTLDDLVSSQIWARRQKFSGPEIETSGNFTGGEYFGSGWGTGGAGIHWYGAWFRFHEADFKEASLYGKGLDWPFDYDELRPWYDQAQRFFGVSGDLAQEPWAPPADPYPMPPLAETGQARVLKRGFDAKGLATSPNSLAINSQPYDGRPACLLDGWCDAGCPIGALANPQALQLPRALAAGARLQHNSYVTRIVTDAAGSQATGVEYVTPDGTTVFQPAHLVIVACHTINNSRLLLLSANDAHPDGLGNASGMVGRHYTSHPIVTIAGLFDEPTNPGRAIPCGNLLSRDGYDDKEPGDGAFGSRSWLAGQTAKPNDLLGQAMARPDLIGDKLTQFLQRGAQGFASMTAICEELSEPDNRITLSKTKRDWLGRPAAHVSNTLPNPSAIRRKQARDEGVEIFHAAGADEVWVVGDANMHMMGGTPMGDDPERSVTNGFGRLHGVDNVFVAGASLFPTSAAVNPTATLAALVLRTADHLRTNAHVWTRP